LEELLIVLDAAESVWADEEVLVSKDAKRKDKKKMAQYLKENKYDSADFRETAKELRGQLEHVSRERDALLAQLSEQDRGQIVKDLNDVRTVRHLPLMSATSQRFFFEKPRELGQKTEKSFSAETLEAAERMGLERVDIQGYPEAQKIIDQVWDKKLDVTTAEGQKEFVRLWKEKVGSLPMPCVPEKKDFWYLTKLYEGKIVPKPDYATSRTIFVDRWEEKDWYASAPDGQKILQKPGLSKILSEYGLGDRGVVNISRNELDQAIAKHQPSVAQKLHDPSLGARPLSIVECAVLSQDPRFNLGKSDLWTHQDGEFLGAKARLGLISGDRIAGGVSHVNCNGWVGAGDGLAIRLVLARKD
jgi:hypothetical protein